jgi:type III secretion protein L
MDEKIIKAKVVSEAAGGGFAPKVVRHEVFDASQKAREITDGAAERARGILAEAGREAAEIRERARQEGREEGLTRWNQLVHEASLAREQGVRNCEWEVLRLAVRVAEKIIGAQLQLAPGTIADIVAEALKGVRHERSISILVNPQTVEHVRERMHRLQAVSGVAREIQVVPSPAVAPGGCVVETEFGTIDAQLETQLKCMEAALLRAARE